VKFAKFVDVRRYSIVNAFICLSYFTFFLAFYSRKYDKTGRGSLYSMIGVPKKLQKAIFTVQRVILPHNVEAYLLKQGLVVPEVFIQSIDGSETVIKKAQ